MYAEGSNGKTGAEKLEEAERQAREQAAKEKAEQEAKNNPKRRKTVKEFCDAYKPAHYTVGNYIESGYAYFLTAPAFAGKTQFATTLAQAIVANRSDLLGLEVREGRVAYLALENPDDTRKRIMAQRYEYGLDHTALASKFTIIDEFTRRDSKGQSVSPLISAGAELRQDANENGPFSVVIIDSWQAAMRGGFNDNNDMLEAAQLCRAFTKLPGNPAVIVLAHPVKNAAEDNLVPYGGGAAANEFDGNFTLWPNKQTGIIKFHWFFKLRASPFEPMFFKIKTIQCPDVLDDEGRQCELPIMMPIEEDEEENRKEKTIRRQKKVLVELLNPTASIGGIAEKLDIPKSSVQTTYKQLAKLGLIEEVLDGWVLSKKGKTEANRIKDDVPF